MAKITENQIIFSYADFVAGNAKNNAVRVSTNPSNQSTSNFDPFRNYGIAQPGKLAVNATNNSGLAGVVVAGVLKNTTLAYCIDSGGKFHEYTYSTNTLNTGGAPFPQTLSGTLPVGQDVKIYKHNSSSVPVFSVFYSWYNNTNWNVGAFVDYTGTPDEDFMSTIPATPLDIASASPADGRDVAQKSAPHIMEIGSDDILYIGSGRYLHAYDGATGTNGTFYNRVLSLPQGFTITGLLRSQDKMLITGVYSGITGTINSASIDSAGEAMVYVWNYIDLDITQVISLDDPYVSSIFMWRGNIHVVTEGESEGFGTFKAVKVKVIIGNSAVKIAELTGNVAFRGVDGSSQVLYLNSAGKIYAIGDNTKDGFQVTNVASCTRTGSNGGWIKNIVGNILLSSGTDSSLHDMSKFSAASFAATAQLETGYYPLDLPKGMKAQIESVQVEYYTTVTSATVAFIVTISGDTGTIDSTVMGDVTTVAAPLQKIYRTDASGNPFRAFSNISIRLIWRNATGSTSAPQVASVIINYKLIAIPT